ncbi:hypothetical protein EOA13_35285 [Mesorhizobium sp. M7A.F.Ca.US.011.01.1.1]|nr:hypothetical protein [Mesorhizobium sp. M7A.F.Ca.US.010.02.1.1]RUW86938.1 hypothetical protein EOA19_34000 [Mesorhizobium sp. M7A.F.Ca.US.010.02.1.1]RUX22836.1 hypothetical protein EOA13_35285 [Mesorhizobium sp. M7A.F.Ca.US.011.01.1.1]
MNAKTAALAITASLCIAGFAYSSGHEAGRVSQLKDTVSAYNRRMGIDDKANSLGRVDLCLELGGLLDECERIDR